jgi:hypothetical protein
VQPSSITRPTLGILAALVVLACTDLRSQIAFSQGDPFTWSEAPEYVSLFAPQAHRTHYRAYLSPGDIGATLQQLFNDSGVLRPPGAWEPQPMIPYDAFGVSGGYNRWKVAGLYRSRRAYVSRGPRMNEGQMESWTLIAPYPDTALQRLEPGTLIIVLRIPPADLP